MAIEARYGGIFWSDLATRTPHSCRIPSTAEKNEAIISERHPEKAYEPLSYRVHGKPAHNYAVAVTEQAEKIREVTDGGRSLEETLDVAEREFGRHLRQAMNLREA